MTPKSSGQTLIEFIFSVTLVGLALLGTAQLLNTQWRRLQCAYLVFEQTHAHLIGGRLKLSGRRERPDVQIHIEKTPSHYIGKAVCGELTETIQMRKLEPDPNPNPNPNHESWTHAYK